MDPNCALIDAAKPAPEAYDPATSDTAEARDVDDVVSEATTMHREITALRDGRPSAKMATNHQKLGLVDASTVRARPLIAAHIRVGLRPNRSADAAMGSPNSDARRLMPRPIPIVVAEIPAWSAKVAPLWRTPNA